MRFLKGNTGVLQSKTVHAGLAAVWCVLLVCAAPAATTPTTAEVGLDADHRDSTLDRVAAAVAHGYWAARPDSAAPGGWVRGPRYRFRSVAALVDRGGEVAGFTTDEWTGEPATALVIARVQTALQRHLSRDGFVFAAITTALRADSAGEPLADLTLTVTRGSAFKLGDPIVRETRTRPSVARRLALWQEDENFDPERIDKGLARLRRQGYFESVEAQGLFRDSLRNVIYPVLRLPDAPTNTIGGLLGYDSEAASGTRLTGFLDVRLLNMRGTARDFEFTFDARTGREREARLYYTEPWIFGLPLGARYEGRFLQQDTIFREWNQSLFVFRDLDFVSRLEAEFGAQANRDFLSETGTIALLSGVRILYDSRDRVPFTRSGWRGHAGVTGLRRTLQDDPAAGGGDSLYYLAQLRIAGERWTPLTPRVGVKTGVAAATNLPLNRLNPGELFDVGGARSLRGYRERQFQTNAYAISDAELQFSVGRRGRLFGFVSPGVVNNPVGRYDLRRVLGYGTGMEIAQGDWSVALTYALNPERSLGNGYLHAAVENRF
jgi:outer membrane protein assembly factor BamA